MYLIFIHMYSSISLTYSICLCYVCMQVYLLYVFSILTYNICLCYVMFGLYARVFLNIILAFSICFYFVCFLSVFFAAQVTINIRNKQ